MPCGQLCLLLYPFGAVFVHKLFLQFTQFLPRCLVLTTLSTPNNKKSEIHKKSKVHKGNMSQEFVDICGGVDIETMKATIIEFRKLAKKARERLNKGYGMCESETYIDEWLEKTMNWENTHNLHEMKRLYFHYVMTCPSVFSLYKHDQETSMKCDKSHAIGCFSWLFERNIKVKPIIG